MQLYLLISHILAMLGILPLDPSYTNISFFSIDKLLDV